MQPVPTMDRGGWGNTVAVPRWGTGLPGWGVNYPRRVNVGDVGFIGPVLEHINSNRSERILEVGEFEVIVEREWNKACLNKLKMIQRKAVCDLVEESQTKMQKQMDQFSDDFYYEYLDVDDENSISMFKNWSSDDEEFFRFLTTLKYKHLYDFAFFALDAIKTDVKSMLHPGIIFPNYYRWHQVSFF